MIESWLLELLVCPKCRGGLRHETEPESLVCAHCRLRYEVKDDIPILLVEEARALEPAA